MIYEIRIFRSCIRAACLLKNKQCRKIINDNEFDRHDQNPRCRLSSIKILLLLLCDPANGVVTR